MSDRPAGNDRLDDHVDEDEHDPALKESAEGFRDRLPSTPDIALGSKLETLGRMLATGLLWPPKALASILISILDTFGLFLGLLPLVGARIWKKVAKRSFEQYDKAHSGDVTGIVTLDSGEVDFYGIDFVEGDDDEKPGWTPTNGWDKVWHEGAEGREVDQLGKAKVALFDESAHQRATPTEARWAQALALGKENVQDLYRNANLSVVKIDPSANDAGAIADGGAVQSEVTVDAKGELEDNLVDIGPGDGYDGTRISTKLVKETYRDKAGSEQMELNEERAFLAGMRNSETPSLGKILLYVAMIVAAATMGPPFVSGLFSEAGGGSSSGGGMLPFMIDASQHALTVLPSLGVM